MANGEAKPETPSSPEAPSSGGGAERSISKAGSWVKGAAAKTREKALAATGYLNTNASDLLRFEDPGNANEVSFIKTPFYAAGDVLDGTALTAGRRVWEMTRDTAANARAIYRTITRPFLHPANTLRHPIKYAENGGRILTTQAKIASDIVNALPRSIDEFANRTIKRPLQRIGAKIPVIGRILSGIGSIAGKVAGIPRAVTQWVTSPIEKLDNWMSSKQNG
ncbi:MAG: hypothetical protein ABIH78_04810 [Candidatus Peregrinibacteria bacterium]